MTGKRILLIIGGGIAAYKCLDLIRRLREEGVAVRVVMTRAAQQFVTPLSVGALTNERVFTGLFDLDDEREIGHIRLSRAADLLLVAPATADLLAKMAGGHADDLATTTLMATDKPVLVAPAMNPKMWAHPATQRNIAQLRADGIQFIGPEAGEMAESGEAGVGRMAEVPALIAAIKAALGGKTNSSAALAGRPLAGHPLAGQHVLVTAGPTHEPIDPVRYIANRSSGKQGYAIAVAAAQAGARVTLVSGPASIAAPAGVDMVRVETAMEMLDAVRHALPADIGIFAAAVADWRVESESAEKIKKPKGAKAAAPKLALVENPDILRTICADAALRPRLVIGFAAETEHVLDHAAKKLRSKGCDWIVANDVSQRSGIEGGVMGGERNIIHVLSGDGTESWPDLSKTDVALRLIAKAAAALGPAKAGRS